MDVLEVDTPQGPARAHVGTETGARGALVLGHGAGGSVQAPDLQTAAAVARRQKLSVVLVEQPYRVAGRRSAPSAPRLDEAWLAVIEHLRAGGPLAGVALIQGGRSSGARVACRTAGSAGAVAVLCLAFPLFAPRRSGPPSSREQELEAPAVPVLVVQGDRDRFGMPRPGPNRTVVEVPGDHGLRAGQEAIAAAIGPWLAALDF